MNCNLVFVKNVLQIIPFLISQKKIREALDKNKFACDIFIDLQKAFDTVDHDILLQKLNHDIRGIINSWFKSYLCYNVCPVFIKKIICCCLLTVILNEYPACRDQSLISFKLTNWSQFVILQSFKYN